MHDVSQDTVETEHDRFSSLLLPDMQLRIRDYIMPDNHSVQQFVITLLGL